MVDISNEGQYDEVVRRISPDQFQDSKLNPAYPVSKYFGEMYLPEMMVHILVELPRERKRKAPTDGVTNSAKIHPALVFSAKELRVFDSAMLQSNQILSDTRASDFIKLIKIKLQAQRSMEAANQEILKRNFGGDLNVYLKVVDGNVDCSYEETIFYTSLFLHCPAPSSLEVGDAIACLGYYFRSLGAYLCKSTPECVFRSEGYWPFKLVGRVDEKLYSYHPRNDFLCLLEGYPYLLIEVCSDKQRELDGYRMLLQAGQLVRVMNSFKDDTEEPFKSFTVVAVYLNGEFVAERYLVYQEDRNSPQVRYSGDRFNLTTPIGTFKFLFELHNLPSVLPADPDLSNASVRLTQLYQDVHDACLGGFTTKNTKHDEPETNHSNTPPGGGVSGPFGDRFTVHKLSNAGYQVLPEPEIEDWTLLNPLKPTLSRAKRSTGEVVMLKLVSSDEFTIHSFLDSIKSQCNHTIPILDQVALGIEIIVAMPSEMVLAHAPASVLETGGNIFAHQFLERVRFMHQQHVPHLDLKPDHLLITVTAKLIVIDFSFSVRRGVDPGIPRDRGMGCP